MAVTETTTDLPTVTKDTLSVRRGPSIPRVRRRSAHRRQPQPAPLPSGTAMTLWVLMSFGLLAVWFVSYALLFSSVQQAASQRQLFAEFREQLALATAPLGGTIEPGSPVSVLESSALGLSNEVVVEGTSSGQTQLGIGHRRDTPLPGQPGVAVLYGRSVTFGAPLERLPLAIPGQTLTLTTGQGTFDYEVQALRRAGDPLPQPLTDGESRLILVSSESSGRFQALTASTTVYVDAVLVGKSVAAPAGRPATIAADEGVMAGDRSGLMPLVLWLEALLLAALALAWMRVRWGTWPTWVVGVPVVVGLLWGATSNVFVLLPNLL